MAHITSIGAGVYSAMAMNKTAVTDLTTVDTLAECVAKFTNAADFVEIKNVRDFPQIGDPANIVNVPVYGKKLSAQVNAQADAPTLELTINYVPSEWTSGAAAAGTDLGRAVGDGKLYVFQFSLLNAEPAGLTTTAGANGLGSVENSNFYFVGKIESLLVTPSLSDANTATVTFTTVTDFFGPGTVAGA